MFALSLILGVIAFLAAAALAYRLKNAAPGTYASADSPSRMEPWPFWVLHFMAPKNWRRLPPGLRIMAFLATTSLLGSVVLMKLLLLRFILDGGHL